MENCIIIHHNTYHYCSFSCNRCFIGNTATFFAAFLAPILAIIVFNSVVFIIVIVVLIRHKRRSNVNIGDVKKNKSKERASTIRLMISLIGIMSLFGLSWVFGALTVDRASLAFQIIFVLLNSLQGFFIFLFFCVLGRDSRELWLELLFCGRYKSSHLHPSSGPASSGNTNGKSGNILLSANTSSTSAPTLEKSFVSETGGQHFADFSTKTDLTATNGDTHISTDLDNEYTPEPTAVTFKGVDENKDDTVDSDTRQGLKARIKRYSTKKEFRHHVETYEVDFDEDLAEIDEIEQ